MRIHIKLGNDIEIECEDEDFKLCMDATHILIDTAMEKRNQLIITEQAINSTSEGDMALKPLISPVESHIASVQAIRGYN